MNNFRHISLQFKDLSNLLPMSFQIVITYPSRPQIFVCNLFPGSNAFCLPDRRVKDVGQGDFRSVNFQYHAIWLRGHECCKSPSKSLFLNISCRPHRSQTTPPHNCHQLGTPHLVPFPFVRSSFEPLMFQNFIRS